MRSLCSCPPIPDFWADSRECQGFNEVKGKLKVFSETFCHLSINIQMLECSASFPWNSCHCWDNKTSSILKHIPTLNPLWKRELFLRCLVWKQSSGKSSFPPLITTNHREIPENSLHFHNSHVQKDGVTAWIPGSQRSFPTESVL